MKTIVIRIFFLAIIFNCILLSQTDSIETENTIESDTLFVMQKSPLGALLRSAVLPGWGQFYNESYYKIPIVWGISGWLIYNYFDNHNLYKQYRDLYLKTNLSGYKEYREFYRDQRDLFAIYYVFAFLANLVDAYVDAHLFDFSVTEDFFRKTPMLNLRFNLR